MKSAFALTAIGALAASAAGQTFTFNGTGGGIPDFAGAPGSFSSSVVVGALGPIADVTVDLDGLFHTWSGDLIITLAQSGGPTVTLVNRIGVTGPGAGDATDYGGNYTFANTGADIWAAAAALGTTADIGSGTYQASGAGSGAANNAFDAFDGLGSAGTWTLRITDNAGLDIGTLAGWRLNITVVPAPSSMALLGLGGLAVARRRRA